MERRRYRIAPFVRYMLFMWNTNKHNAGYTKTHRHTFVRSLYLGWWKRVKIGWEQDRKSLNHRRCARGVFFSCHKPWEASSLYDMYKYLYIAKANPHHTSFSRRCLAMVYVNGTAAHLRKTDVLQPNIGCTAKGQLQSYIPHRHVKHSSGNVAHQLTNLVRRYYICEKV